jgi:hypothetical protein
LQQKVKKQTENTIFEKPYLKNGGIGLVLFGVYYLLISFSIIFLKLLVRRPTIT